MTIPLRCTISSSTRSLCACGAIGCATNGTMADREWLQPDFVDAARSMAPACDRACVERHRRQNTAPSICSDQLAHQRPALAVESRQLVLAERDIVVGRLAERHARQQHLQPHMVE